MPLGIVIGKEKEKSAFPFHFPFFICVGCIRAFFRTFVLDADMVSFGRFGFDVRKYEGPGNEHKDRGTLSLSPLPNSIVFPFPPPRPLRISVGISLDNHLLRAILFFPFRYLLFGMRLLIWLFIF